MANYKIIETFRRRSIHEMTDLLVRSAYTHLQRLDLHLIISRNLRSYMFHKANLPFERKNTNSTHLFVHQDSRSTSYLVHSRATGYLIQRRAKQEIFCHLSL